MTAPHTFGNPEVHNDATHWFCTNCGAEKQEKIDGGAGRPYGPYIVGVDAIEFPTCEAAFVEKVRLDAWKRARETERRKELVEREKKLEEFRRTHSRGYYWAKLDPDREPHGELIIVFFDGSGNFWESPMACNEGPDGPGDPMRVELENIIGGRLTPPV